MAISSPIHSWINQVIDRTQTDPQLVKIYHSFLQGKPSYNDYNIQNGLLMFKDKIVLPSDSALLN